MASTFKRNGKGFYIVSWYDHTGNRRAKSSRTTDKRSAERIAAKLESEAALRREGVVDPNLDVYAKEARRPISEHLNDYAAHLKTRCGDDHTTTTTHRIRRIVDIANIGTWRDLTPDTIERALAQITASKKLTPQTRNKYLSAVNTFANWMVKQKRADVNPIAGGDHLEVEQREHRRALKPDEAALLIAAAKAGEPKQGRDRSGRVRWVMTGRQRGLLYRLACESGLRRGAIERLTASNFETGSDPAVTVLPKVNTKNRKRMSIPLKPDTAQMLHDHLRGRLPASKAFDMPAKWETAAMIRPTWKRHAPPGSPRGPRPKNGRNGLRATFSPPSMPKGDVLTFTPCGPRAVLGWIRRVWLQAWPSA